MFWPVILPFQITCGVMFSTVVLLMAFARPKTWNRVKTFFLYSAIAAVAFVPSCIGISLVVDAVRFGDFTYASYDEIPDFRSRRYLPFEATEIQMHKRASGYSARYNISPQDFAKYLDDLWEEYGESSAVARGESYREGKPVDPELFERRFGFLGWECPTSVIIYESPSESDGGGAEYHVDANSGVVYQSTVFW